VCYMNAPSGIVKSPTAEAVGRSVGRCLLPALTDASKPGRRRRHHLHVRRSIHPSIYPFVLSAALCCGGCCALVASAPPVVLSFCCGGGGTGPVDCHRPPPRSQKAEPGKLEALSDSAGKISFKLKHAAKRHFGGFGRASRERGHSPLSPVRIGIGDRLSAGIPPRYVTKPTRSTQPCIPP